MKINVGIREEDQQFIMFVTDKDDKNIGEMEISKKLYEVVLKEWSEKDKFNDVF